MVDFPEERMRSLESKRPPDSGNDRVSDKAAGIRFRVSHQSPQTEHSQPPG